jgi:hypothetical protein
VLQHVLVMSHDVDPVPLQRIDVLRLGTEAQLLLDVAMQDFADRRRCKRPAPRRFERGEEAVPQRVGAIRLDSVTPLGNGLN